MTINSISVFSSYDHVKRSFLPLRLEWRGRTYLLTKLNYHCTRREGRTLHHIFAVSNDTAAFKLKFDTESLSWTLEEFYDAAGS